MFNLNIGNFGNTNNSSESAASHTSTLNESFNTDSAMMENEEARFQSVFTEACLVYEYNHMTEEQRKAVNESGVLDQLQEAGKMRKKTIVRIGQKDDLERRRMLAAIERARINKDRLWNLLRLNRIKERALLGAIDKKYGNIAARDAKASQKDYIKNRLPNRQELFGNNLNTIK